MRKITLLIALLVLFIIPLNAQTDINFDADLPCAVDPDPPVPCWSGFMNWFNLPAPYGDGAFQFQSGWGVADLVAELDTNNNTVTLKPNRIGDPDPYWQTGDLTGNKFYEGALFIADNDLRGVNFTFNGSVDSNTLNNNGLYADLDWTVTAFIRVFNADFSAVLDEDVIDLRVTSGDFTLTMDATGYNTDQNIQYGFNFTGPNIGLDSSFDSAYDALGSIVIGANNSLSTIELSEVQFQIGPNPTSDRWMVNSQDVIESIQVFDLLGKRVISLEPNAVEAEIEASSLKSGIYLARLKGLQGTKTIKLVKN